MTDSEVNESACAAAELIHDREAISGALDRMAADINQALEGQSIVLLTVMNGGLIPAAELALRLNLDLQMDYVHASRYRGRTQGTDSLMWHALPNLPLEGRSVLLVDDILDEGKTLKALIEHCQAQGVAQVHSAVLVEKLHDRRVAGLKADFVGLEVPDRYVFGFGMDYGERFRHLPAIYALPQG